MSCCCPPAIAAIFCLWVRNGFSKACVAGALTFFPPEPPLYTFLRVDKDGTLLEGDDGLSSSDDEYEDDDEEEERPTDNDLKVKEEREKSGLDEEQVATPTVRNRKRRKRRPQKPVSGDPEHQNKADMAALTERQKKLERTARRKFRRDQADEKRGITYKFVVEESLCPSRFAPYLQRMEAVKLYNKRAKSYLAVVVYKVPQQEGANDTTAPEKTILYSHGNATDAGGMSLMQCYLARGLQVNIVMYDYSGYGESGGTALEHNTYTDIDTVYNYTLQNLAQNDPDNIIIYGQSVGSGPSCHICSRRPAGGLILHSPFMSGIRVLTPSRALACLDIFPNIDRIKRVRCPVMVIHGMQDEEVDQGHGLALHNAVPKQYQREPWWVPDRGHNDICEGSRHMNEYVQRIKTFLTSLKEEGGEGGTEPNTRK